MTHLSGILLFSMTHLSGILLFSMTHLSGILLLSWNLGMYSTCRLSHLTDLNKRASASSTISAAVGASLGRYPYRLNRPMNLSTLPLSPSEANPHQAGAAYSRVAIVVARVTSSRCSEGRPLERRVLRATIEAAHLTRVSSKCNVMLRSALSVTPRTFCV